MRSFIEHQVGTFLMSNQWSDPRLGFVYDLNLLKTSSWCSSKYLRAHSTYAAKRLPDPILLKSDQKYLVYYLVTSKNHHYKRVSLLFYNKDACLTELLVRSKKYRLVEWSSGTLFIAQRRLDLPGQVYIVACSDCLKDCTLMYLHTIRCNYCKKAL